MTTQGIFRWENEHFPRAQDGIGLSSKGLFPISDNAVLTDIGAFLSRIKFDQNLHLFITMQTPLKAYQSVHRHAKPFFLQRPLKVTELHIG